MPVVGRQPNSLEEEEEPVGRRLASLVPVLLLGAVGCILLGMRDCNRPPPAPVQPPAEAVTNAPSTAAETTPAVVAPVTNAAPGSDAALQSFALYRRDLRDADFVGASNALRSVDARLGGEVSRTAFWDANLPADRRLTLTLAQVCQTCTNGVCWRCEGRGQCESCSGAGVCPNCHGQSLRSARCTACLCNTCKGNGRCDGCQGQGLVRCLACAGSGSTAIQERIPCPACGGSGQRRGLARAGSDQSAPFTCLTCRGNGNRTVSHFGTCPTCSGRGRMACTRCSGSGRCASCSGMGRRAVCRTCSNTGQAQRTCPQCKGTSRCVDCKGSGHCPVCEGARSCARCKGAGIIRQWEFPIDSKWIMDPAGFIVFDSTSGQREASGTDTGQHELHLLGHRLVFDLREGELLWISNGDARAQVKKLFWP